MDDCRAKENGRRDDDRLIKVLLAHVKALELRQIEHERKYFTDRRSDAKLFRLWRDKYTQGLQSLEGDIQNNEASIERVWTYLRFARWGGYGAAIMLTGYITLFIDRFKALFVIGSN